MTKKEFLDVVDELQKKIGHWQLEVGTEIFADYSMGCFYDENEKMWKVYVNNERGRHRIRLVTEEESEAFDELMSIVEFEIVNNKYI